MESITTGPRAKTPILANVSVDREMPAPRRCGDLMRQVRASLVQEERRHILRTDWLVITKRREEILRIEHSEVAERLQEFDKTDRS